MNIHNITRYDLISRGISIAICACFIVTSVTAGTSIGPCSHNNKLSTNSLQRSLVTANKPAAKPPSAKGKKVMDELNIWLSARPTAPAGAHTGSVLIRFGGHYKYLIEYLKVFEKSGKNKLKIASLGAGDGREPISLGTFLVWLIANKDNSYPEFRELAKLGRFLDTIQLEIVAVDNNPSQLEAMRTNIYGNNNIAKGVETPEVVRLINKYLPLLRKRQMVKIIDSIAVSNEAIEKWKDADVVVLTETLQYWEGNQVWEFIRVINHMPEGSAILLGGLVNIGELTIPLIGSEEHDKVMNSIPRDSFYEFRPGWIGMSTGINVFILRKAPTSPNEDIGQKENDILVKESIYEKKFIEQERSDPRITIVFDLDDTLAKYFNGQFILRPGTIELLTILKYRGLKLVLWTSAGRGYMRQFLKEFPQLQTLFERAIAREDCVFPHPDIFEKLDKPKREFVYNFSNIFINGKPISFLGYDVLIDDNLSAARQWSEYAQKDLGSFKIISPYKSMRAAVEKTWADAPADVEIGWTDVLREIDEFLINATNKDGSGDFNI